MAKVQSEARLIVALHIGSFYSGFAHARKGGSKNIFVFRNWPRPVEKRSSMELSAIYYEPGDAATAKVKSWGFSAYTDHERAINSESSKVGTFFRNFKDARESSTALLQNDFTLTQVISDYLQLVGAFIVRTLQGYGSHVSMNDVEWCVALAHDWGDHGMKLMRTSMKRAGLVQSAISRGGSPHPLLFVPELDAASYHCLRRVNDDREIKGGDKLLVAYLGYESCRIIVHEVYSVERSKFEVKQVAESVAVVGGRKQWDKVLMELLLAKMLPVQDNVLKVYPFKQFCESLVMKLSWDRCYDFDKNYLTSYRYKLPINDQTRWKQLDVEHGNPIRSSYDVIEVTLVEFQTAVKPCLDEYVAHIARQFLSKSPDISAILLVGEPGYYPSFFAKIRTDLNSLVKVVYTVHSAARTGAVAMVLDQVLPFTWNGGEKLLEDGAASSSHGDGITGQTSSPEFGEVLPARGSTSPSFESSNAFGDDEASVPSPRIRPRKTRVKGVLKKSGGSKSNPLLTCEWSTTSPSIESSNAFGGSEASEPSPENKPRNSRVGSVVTKFSWDQVLQMTDGLTSRELGKGGFGTVYLGKFETGKEVAVKVLNQSSQEGKLETFVNEVNLLIKVNHVNLVKLLGYCQDKQNVVIYEYAEEGSIGDHLHGDKTRLNDWKLRLSIMLQAAYGLDYLHSLCSPTIIHRDIKSENILLTKNMVAKVADFGISKLVGVDDADMKTYINTKVIGSHWYIDPEYQETGQLRQSSDVYSFGIVLLEIISGRKPCGIGAWVNKLYGSGGGGAIKGIADSSFNGNYNPKAMKVVIKLAISCIDVDGTSRPMIRQVVGELHKAQSIEEEDKKSWIPFWR